MKFNIYIKKNILLKKKRYNNIYLISKDLINLIKIMKDSFLIKKYKFFLEDKKITNINLFNKKYNNLFIKINSKKKLNNNITLFFNKKENFINFYKTFKNAIYGSLFGWTLKLIFMNINFKVYTNSQEILFFVGQSHGTVIKYDSNSILILLNKKKKYLKLISISKKKISDLGKLIKNLRPISPYKNKGIYYSTEKIIYKKGKEKLK